MNEQHIFVFLLQLFILLGAARFLGEVFTRFRQPALTAEILVGVCFGPTILGRFFPQIHGFIFPSDPMQRHMFETVAWLGAFFFLLETGLEIDFSSAWRRRGDALKIALTDIIVPMVLGFACAWFLPNSYLVSVDNKLMFCFFMATALTISAMPITARALHDLHLKKTDLGFLIMSALSVNDVIGWLVFTVVFGFFIQSGARHDQMGIMIAMAVAFVVLCLTGGRVFSNWAINRIRTLKLPEPSSSLTFIFLLGLLCGAVAQKVGLHALFGFLLAGIMAGEAKALSEKTRQTISQMVYAVFVPIFFVSIGLKMDFLAYFDPVIVLFVAVIGISLRFLGAWIGVSLCRIPKTNRLTIAIAHTPGGMMEIVMGLLALDFKLITPTVFVGIVFGALITAIVMGPWLAWGLGRRKQVSVFEFFSRRGIIIPLKVENREEALRVLAQAAAQEDDLYDDELIVHTVLEREQMMGTAIEEGVALPHARLAGLRKPVIIFGRSLSGVDWNSPDGKPSNFIFLILTPDNDDAVQVQILQAIARVMQDPANRQAVLNARDASQAWDIFQSAFTQLYVERLK
ncbi:MAG: cation:proton antiporter [Candidatus Omnitrophica bacterium]|nr:cation:proton antiporter [Candidatus Omnitrophota bacterium]